MSDIDYTQTNDRFFDYCLWEYKPVVPFQNKYRSINILTHSFLNYDASKACNIVKTIQSGIGAHETVWGIKNDNGNISWEFYFYDYERRHRKKSISKVLDTLSTALPCDIEADENIHYFMFSFEINKQLLNDENSLDELDMYIGNVGSTVSSGICYSVKKDSSTMKNFYFFFDAKEQQEDIVAKICCSAYLDTSKININEVLWPELKECKAICLANKRNHDCIYFSGINIDQLLVFMKRLSYPQDLIAYIEDNYSMLDHLQYDVGFDYRMENDKLVILKSGYYGIF